MAAICTANNKHFISFYLLLWFANIYCHADDMLSQSSASSISLSGEAGKPGFFGGRVGIPGTYHKYKTVQ